jgi:hypothetical protein
MDASAAKPIAVEISNQLNATTAINKAVSKTVVNRFSTSII